MACEPDLILMGGRMAEYYDELNEIAPTLRLTTVSDDGLVEAIRANAKTIGTIFGETEQVDALLAQYDARIAALAAFAEGKTCMLGMSTSGSFNLLGNDGRCSLIVNEVGFDNIGADARVSTDSEEQLTSYAAQVDYYTNYIKGRDDWEFVAVYTDEGITGTNTKHREGFKRMVADALDGKIDLIVTKSVSRFARNTVDSLTTVRQLKEKGVEIYFEKEYIETALYLISTPNTGLFFVYCSICCGFSGYPETVYCVLSLICRLNLQ